MVNLGTLKGRKEAMDLNIFEVSQNIELLDLIEKQSKKVERMLWKKYGKIWPVELLMTIPGWFLVGFDFVC